jgi:hypothetical protein
MTTTQEPTPLAAEAEVHEHLESVSEKDVNWVKKLTADIHQSAQALRERVREELKSWSSLIEEAGRAQLFVLGGELITLGQRLQELAGPQVVAAAVGNESTAETEIPVAAVS